MPGTLLEPGAARSDAGFAAKKARAQTPHQPMSTLRVVLTSGSGFFTDAYDLFVIGLVIPVVEFLYFPNHKMPSYEKGAIAAVSLAGTLVGQLFFGYLGDRLGRKRTFIATSCIIAVASFGSATAFHAGPVTMLGSLVFWRLVLGVGIGGDYPLAAVVSSESSHTAQRGRVVASVFAMQGFGILAAAIIMLIALSACGPSRLDLAWRVALGFGGLAAVVSFYFRLTMHESPRFEKGAHEHADADSESGPEMTPAPSPAAAPPSTLDLLRARGWLLFATCSTWFLLDVAFYSQNLFNPTVLTAIGFSGVKEPRTPEELYASVHKICVGQLLIALCATVPGYWVTVATIESLGRRRIQLIGFAAMTIAFAVLAAAYQPLVSQHGLLALFLVIYAMTFFFSNFGPNSTTFILPSELFPTAIRSTAHGISAASGKAGAIVAAFFFPSFEERFGAQWALGVMSICLVAGYVITWALIPETAGKSLEDLEEGVEMGALGGRSAPAGEHFAYHGPARRPGSPSDAGSASS
eukprot:tig00021073_g18059.t1